MFSWDSSILFEEEEMMQQQQQQQQQDHHHHRSRQRSNSHVSEESDSSHPGNPTNHHHHNKPIEPPVLVYHESARSIVFRDQVRRRQQQAHHQDHTKSTHTEETQEQGEEMKNRKKEHSAVSDSDDDTAATADYVVEIQNYQPKITPLPPLELTARNEFEPLLREQQQPSLTPLQRRVVKLLEQQRACVKTIANHDWTAFLERFTKAQPSRNHLFPNIHDDIEPITAAVTTTDEEERQRRQYNSFVTSTSLLPPFGKKMRAYGSLKEYSAGVVFALPGFQNPAEEAASAERTQTWCWPSGYSAKTEFNIDSRGNLINGRREALVTMDKIRQNNHDYITKQDYEICGRLVRGGLTTVPYNEVFLRVGGTGPVGLDDDLQHPAAPSFEHGVGLPLALFVRSASYGHLISLLRTRARVEHWLPCLKPNHSSQNCSLPLLYITPETGVRVLTQEMEQELLRIVSRSLNPFQNPAIAYKTTMESTDNTLQLEQKREELLDLDAEMIQKTLTAEERARLAGGFGATDDSVAQLLMEAMRRDESRPAENGDESHRHNLQDIVNEGLASAVRSGDYHTARQLLILYSLVASKGHQQHEQLQLECDVVEDGGRINSNSNGNDTDNGSSTDEAPSFGEVLQKVGPASVLSKESIPPPPPPPPLDTDRLRSATNSDGLLAVLGAAQVLKAMRDGGAKRRVMECVSAIDEWIEHGENSVAFRLASWRDQHAAQADLKIAMEHDSSFMAFISGKAISNRKAFANRLREASEQTNMDGVQFLKSIHDMVSKMHSPCLRLELLQFILGLDNRFSVAHLTRSVELAATCLNVSSASTGLPAPPRALAASSSSSSGSSV